MATIVSCGRRKTMEHNERKTFVFGSSTPRDLSYMDRIPTALRIYDSKIKPIKRANNQTLAHFMRQARSVTRNQSKSRDDPGDYAVRGTFAFGSSTPRILSHLCGTAKEYFDDRINPQIGRRSYTTPTFPTSLSKTIASPLSVQIKRNATIRKPNGTEEKKIISKSTCQAQNTNRQSKKKKGIFLIAAFENENKKVLLLKKREEVTLADEMQLLNANTVENEAKMLPAKSTAAKL